MTICASVKVRDGLVLGTDSMAQIWGRDAQGKRGAVKTYGNARKLFQVGKLQTGVMSYGIGNLGQRSIQGFLREFSSIYSDDASVEAIAANLFRFFSEPYAALFGEGQQRPTLGFFVAGYSPDQPFSKEWEFRFPDDNSPRQVRPLEVFGASWRGTPFPFTRLYKGYDPRIVRKLKEEGITDEIIDNTVKAFHATVVYRGMPVQDAVNFVVFILRTTIGLTSFEIGPPICGGPLQIASLLPSEGFRWISEPILSVQS